MLFKKRKKKLQRSGSKCSIKWWDPTFSSTSGFCGYDCSSCSFLPSSDEFLSFLKSKHHRLLLQFIRLPLHFNKLLMLSRTTSAERLNEAARLEFSNIWARRRLGFLLMKHLGMWRCTDVNTDGSWRLYFWQKCFWYQTVNDLEPPLIYVTISS